MVSKKNDIGKQRMGLLLQGCSRAVKAVASVLTFGALKYDDDNWKGLADLEKRYVDAMYRHLNAWHEGEELDPESGLTHLSHAATNMMFLLQREQEQVSSTYTNIRIPLHDAALTQSNTSRTGLTSPRADEKGEPTDANVSTTASMPYLP